MPSLRAYCLTGVSLTLDVGYLFMAEDMLERYLQQSAATVPYLERGVAPHSQCS